FHLARFVIVIAQHADHRDRAGAQVLGENLRLTRFADVGEVPAKDEHFRLGRDSANSSRTKDVRSSLTCKSPMAAKVNVSGLLAMASPALLACVRKTPFLDRRLVVDLREHPPAAYLHARRRQVQLLLESAEQLSMSQRGTRSRSLG